MSGALLNAADLEDLHPVPGHPGTPPKAADMAAGMRKQIESARASGGTPAVVAKVEQMRAHARDPEAHAALRIAEQDLKPDEKKALEKAGSSTPAPVARKNIPHPAVTAKKHGPPPKGAKAPAKGAHGAHKGGKAHGGKKNAAPPPAAVPPVMAPVGAGANVQGRELVEQQLAVHEQWESWAKKEVQRDEHGGGAPGHAGAEDKQKEAEALKAQLFGHMGQDVMSGLGGAALSVGIGLGVQAIAKKIPLEGVGNVVGLGIMLISAGGPKGLIKQIGGQAHEVAEAAKGLFSNENWALKLADFFTLICKVAELVSTIANVLSGLAYALAGLSAVLAGLGFILSFCFPFLIPVVALLAEAVEPLMSFGRIAGTVANVASIVNVVLSPLPPIFRAVGIELIKKDPEQIEEQEKKFDEETTGAISSYGSMAANAKIAGATDDEWGGKSPFQKGSFIKAFGIDEVYEAAGKTPPGAKPAAPATAAPDATAKPSPAPDASPAQETAAKPEDEGGPAAHSGSQGPAGGEHQAAAPGGGNHETASPADEEAHGAGGPDKGPAKDAAGGGPEKDAAGSPGGKPKKGYKEAESDEQKARTEEEGAKKKATTAEAASKASEEKVAAAKDKVAEAEKEYEKAKGKATAEQNAKIQAEARGQKPAFADPDHPSAEELQKLGELTPAQKGEIAAKQKLDEAKQSLEEAENDAKAKQQEATSATNEEKAKEKELEEATDERKEAWKARKGTGADVLKDAGKDAAKELLKKEGEKKEGAAAEKPVILPPPPAPGNLSEIDRLDTEILRLERLAPAIAATTQHALGMKARSDHDAALLKHVATDFEKDQHKKIEAGTKKQQKVTQAGQKSEAKFHQTASKGQGGTGKGAGAMHMIAGGLGFVDGLAHRVPNSKFFHTGPLKKNLDKFKKGMDMVDQGPSKGNKALEPAKPRIAARHKALAKATATRAKTKAKTAHLHGKMLSHSQESTATGARAGGVAQESMGLQGRNAAALAQTRQKRDAKWAQWMGWANQNKAAYAAWQEQQRKKREEQAR